MLIHTPTGRKFKPLREFVDADGTKGTLCQHTRSNALLKVYDFMREPTTMRDSGGNLITLKPEVIEDES